MVIPAILLSISRYLFFTQGKYRKSLKLDIHYRRYSSAEVAETMAETPKFKSSMGGSRGLANLLRQASANPNTITGYAGAGGEGDISPNSSSRSVPGTNSRDMSPIPSPKTPPNRPTLPTMAPPPPPAHAPPPPPSHAPPSIPPPAKPVPSPKNISNEGSRGPIITSPESTVVKNTAFDKPAPPPRRASVTTTEQTLDFSAEDDLSNSISSISVSPKSAPQLPAKPSAPAPPVGKPTPTTETKSVNLQPNTQAIMNSVNTGKKGNISIGAKAGGVYAEASYVGDGDEVDDSEW